MDLPEGTLPTANIKQRDNDLKDKLLANKKGFLKWLVDGAVEWYRTQDLKRNCPPQVKEFGDSYFEEQDVLACFIKDMCDDKDKNARISTSKFLDAFNYWSTDTKHTLRTLVSAMEKKGFSKKKLRINNKPEYGFEGIKLNEDFGLF
jgi:phage/plasmid-associated DNA primase